MKVNRHVRFGAGLQLLAAALSCTGSSSETLLGTSSTGTSNPQGFSALYILASVQPNPFVPAQGFAEKSVIGRCVEIKRDGTLVQEILYSQDFPVSLTRETDAWSYTLSGTDILARDPAGFGSGPEVRRIGSTAEAQIIITRVLRNNGLPVVRTLIFSKVASLSSRCGG